jgi:hypothetical protein
MTYNPDVITILMLSTPSVVKPYLTLFARSCQNSIHSHNTLLLSFGENVIQSDKGVQQGDPLGPRLFCLSIMKLAHSVMPETTAQLTVSCVICCTTLTRRFDALERHAACCSMSTNAKLSLMTILWSAVSQPSCRTFCTSRAMMQYC